ncbi:MAG: DUF3108 domain-containing protein [Clostridium sp.]|nr:DUF3108 domain-containing protein [Bacteroides sp.]MCM1198311.1 DUF3108 domain-containing protein [Clostridium sp.]
MRTFVRISVLAAFLACLSLQSSGQSVGTSGGCIPVRPLAEKDLAYQSGEHLKFTMHYQWGAINSDVGWATADLARTSLNGQEVFLCSVYGRTIRWYDLVFKVREDFRSWFTCDGIRPLQFTRDTKEGKYAATNRYTYMWDAAEPYIDADIYSTSSGQRNMQLPLTSCTYDLPALFYLARNMDFDNVEPGVRHPMTFAIDDDIYNVYFILLGRETRKIKGLGQVKTIKFAAKLLAGEVFTGEEDMTIWVTDDDNRIPVLFEAPILVGVASGRLAEYSGLKHPFTSLIKK